MQQAQETSKQVTFYIIRHGQTVDNVSETLQGQRPGKLNEVGIQQAIERGQQMQDYIIDEAWVSDLKRAHDTFLNIHDQMKNKIPKIQLKQNIRERCFGKAEGWSNNFYREQERLHKEQHGENSEYVAEGAESHADLEKRVALFLEEVKDWALSEANQSNSLVIVSHGIFIRKLLKLLKESAVVNPEILTGTEKYSNVELTEMKFTVNLSDRRLNVSYWNKQLLPGQAEVLDRQQM